MNHLIALFDADGVFLKTDRPGNYLEHRFGLTTAQTAGFREIMGRCIVGQADVMDHLPRFLKEWGREESPTEFLDEAFGSGAGVDESVAEVVRSFRRAKIFCGLATNQDKHRMRYLDDRLAIRGYFDATLVSCELGAKKPEAGYFRAVQAAYPGRTFVFWDDRPENVAAAKAAGWSAFLFRDAAGIRADWHGLGLAE